MSNKNWYAVITADILYDKDLTARQKLLMAVISNMANEKGYCFASNSKLGELMGVSISSIQRDLSKLEEKYLGRVVNLKPNGEVDYRALTPIAKVNPQSPMTPPHSTDDMTPRSTDDHIITNTFNNKINSVKSSKEDEARLINSRNKILSQKGIDRFCSHWFTADENGTFLYDTQNSFNIKNRLQSWKERNYGGDEVYGSEDKQQYERSLTWLIQGNRNFEELDYCLMAYNSGGATPTEQQHLENVLKYKQLI